MCNSAGRNVEGYSEGLPAFENADQGFLAGVRSKDTWVAFSKVGHALATTHIILEQYRACPVAHRILPCIVGALRSLLTVFHSRSAEIRSGTPYGRTD